MQRQQLCLCWPVAHIFRVDRIVVCWSFYLGFTQLASCCCLNIISLILTWISVDHSPMLNVKQVTKQSFDFSSFYWVIWINATIWVHAACNSLQHPVCTSWFFFIISSSGYNIFLHQIKHQFTTSLLISVHSINNL